MACAVLAFGNHRAFGGAVEKAVAALKWQKPGMSRDLLAIPPLEPPRCHIRAPDFAHLALLLQARKASKVSAIVSSIRMVHQIEVINAFPTFKLFHRRAAPMMRSRRLPSREQLQQTSVMRTMCGGVFQARRDYSSDRPSAVFVRTIETFIPPPRQHEHRRDPFIDPQPKFAQQGRQRNCRLPIVRICIFLSSSYTIAYHYIIILVYSEDKHIVARECFIECRSQQHEQSARNSHMLISA